MDTTECYQSAIRVLSKSYQSAVKEGLGKGFEKRRGEAGERIGEGEGRRGWEKLRRYLDAFLF